MLSLGALSGFDGWYCRAGLVGVLVVYGFGGWCLRFGVLLQFLRVVRLGLVVAAITCGFRL